MASNSSTLESYPPQEAVVLLTVGLISTSGNLCALLVMIVYRGFRKASLAVLCHHCFLDLLKSLYCFQYGYSLLESTETPYCNLIGSSYVFLMTTSAYNLVALVVNEEYELMNGDIQKSDRCCVIFGIFIIWLISLLLNLGVAIIPSSTAYIKEIGNCIFKYGEPNSFVLHSLWIILVTVAIVLAFYNFYHMYRRIVNYTKSMKWKYIHKSISGEFQSAQCAEAEEELILKKNSERYSNILGKQSHLQFHLRRIVILVSMVTSFVLFWYPLFVLTIVDIRFYQQNILYKILTILAWSQPITTPIFCTIILRDIKLRESLIRDISTNMLPLKPTEQSLNKYADSHYREESPTFDIGMFNDNFEQTLCKDFQIKTDSFDRASLALGLAEDGLMNIPPRFLSRTDLDSVSEDDNSVRKYSISQV